MRTALIIALSLLLPLVAAAVLAWWFTEMDARDRARVGLDNYQLARAAFGRTTPHGE